MDESSAFWKLALVVSLLFLAGIQYYKSPAFRGWTDEKCPWIKEQLAKYDIKFDEPAAASDSAPAGSTASAAAPSNKNSASGNPSVIVQKKPESSADWAKIAANPAAWPKTVRLKKTTVFPAVMDGKEIGKVNVPAGTEVKLMQMKDDKLGLAYSPNGLAANSGGAWVSAQDTDMAERIQRPVR